MAGHANLQDHPNWMTVFGIVAVIAVAFMGFRNLFHRFDEGRSERIAERLDRKWKHPRAWFFGFLLTSSNLTLLILWATLAAILLARGWVQPDVASRTSCVAGVFTGGLLWYTTLAAIVGRAHRQIHPKTISLLIRICGAFFLVLAATLAYRIFRH